jgi:hypothetical protein
MLLFYLLWITIVFGGFYLGIGYILGLYRGSFQLSLLLNALIYCGCALYGVPKLLRLIIKK